MAKAKKCKNAAEFSKAIDEYFGSISAEEDVIKLVPDGFDDKGRQKYSAETVKDRNGNTLKRTVWYTPPTISGLCIYLDISRKTFNEYAKRDGEYGEAARKARYIVYAYLDGARSDPNTRNVKGVDLAMISLEAAIDAEGEAKEKKMSLSDYEEALKRAMRLFGDGFINDGE